MGVAQAFMGKTLNLYTGFRPNRIPNVASLNYLLCGNILLKAITFPIRNSPSSVTVKIGPRDYWSRRMSEFTGKKHRLLFDETLEKFTIDCTRMHLTVFSYRVYIVQLQYRGFHT